MEVIFLFTHTLTLQFGLDARAVLVILLDYTSIQTSPHNMLDVFDKKIFFDNEKFAIFDRRSSACHWSLNSCGIICANISLQMIDLIHLQLSLG